MRRAAQAPCRWCPLSSNVRPRSNLLIVAPSISTGRNWQKAHAERSCRARPATSHQYSSAAYHQPSMLRLTRVSSLNRRLSLGLPAR
jgi:hypothetical protein